MENIYTPNCIRTFSGKYFNVFDPDPEKICIVDIAHALSNIPRFGGHLPQFYSVSQHSWLVAMMLPAELKLQGLLHDAAEAYLLDIPSPIKSKLPFYCRMEECILQMILHKFDTKYPLNRDVKYADREILNVEWEGLMLGKKTSIIPWGGEYAKNRFLELFHKLKKESHAG